MRKTKKIFTFFLGTLIALSFSVSAFASDIEAEPTLTVKDYDAYVVKNLNPLAQTDTTSKSAYISNNVVHAKGVFYYKVGPLKGLSVQIGNVYGELLAYPSGESSISYCGDKL